jgi:aminoglycoside phosphotransferase (APT) family kinase protein
MGEGLVDALVEVHGVDWAAAGLEGFGKPTGYLERQLRRFGGLWEHNRTREIEAVERVGGWLRDNLPDSGPATIVHGDFRLGNVMFAPSRPPSSWRSSTGRWRRSATRSPTSATCARCGPTATTPTSGCSS